MTQDWERVLNTHTKAQTQQEMMNKNASLRKRKDKQTGGRYFQYT